MGCCAFVLAADGGLVLFATFFAGVFVLEAVAVFFVAGVFIFLSSALATEVFFFAAFLAVADPDALARFGLTEPSPPVLVLDLAPSSFLDADFVFFFAIMSPPSNVKIRNTGTLSQAMILVQTLPVNKLQLAFDAGQSRDYV